MRMDEAGIGSHRQMQLVRRDRQQKHVSGTRPLRGNRTEVMSHAASDSRGIAAAKPVIARNALARDGKDLRHKADAVQPGACVASLRTECASDERPRPLLEMVQISGSRVTGQQIVAGQVRLAAEVRGVLETRHAGPEPFVAPLAEFHSATGLDRTPRQITQAHC